MTENTIDLKQLFYLIRDQKGLNANLNLDAGCSLEVEDPKPLIKVINYILNYLLKLTEHPLEISLDLLPETYRLSMLSFSTTEELPEISSQLKEILNDYKAGFNLEHNHGKYIQVTITFSK